MTLQKTEAVNFKLSTVVSFCLLSYSAFFVLNIKKLGWSINTLLKCPQKCDKGIPKKMHQYTVLPIIGRPINRFRYLNPHPKSLILPQYSSSILILYPQFWLSILNSCSKIVTKVRDSRQIVRTHGVQLFPALTLPS